MAKRTIVHIDENLCDGCRLCIPNCAEGALQIVDGKAKLVDDVLCDGFGACLGHCPQDAITMIERDADDFDEAVVEEHLKTLETEENPSLKPAAPVQPAPAAHGHMCPGSMERTFQNPSTVPVSVSTAVPMQSALGTWPVQLHLLNPNAPFLQDCDLLLAADCVPFAYPEFHNKMLDGKVLAIGCPKLDNVEPYLKKLAQIFQNGIRSLTVAIMEVPCCGGMLQLAMRAMQMAGRQIPLTVITVGIRGTIVDERVIHPVSEVS